MPSSDQIGRYRVERRLGAGAFATVWLAHDDRLQAPVAIKVMAENWAARPDIRERFLTEARLLRKAMSGEVIQIFDIGELDDGRPYFVMEHADRGTLEDRLTTVGPLPVPEALHLTARVARGVHTLHEAGIVHRDLKPSNVLLAGSGVADRDRVLVADLGLAKNLAQASGMTAAVGSVGFMAPEQAEPVGGIDARADVYSLGAVLYHLVTGRVPGLPGKAVSPERLRRDLPSEVTDAIGWAMHPNRERRWATAEMFADALDRIAAGEPGAAAAEDPGSGETAPTPASFSSVTPEPVTPATPEPAGSAAPTPDAPEPGVSVLVSEPKPRPATGTSAEPAETPPAPSVSPAPPAPSVSPAPPVSSVSPVSPVSSAPVKRSGRRIRLVVLCAVVAVLAGTGVGGIAVFQSRDGSTEPATKPSTVQVRDTTGRVSMAVPAAWAKETVDSGWKPASLGLPGQHAPGLLVAQETSRWSDLTSTVSGVFVGLGAGEKGHRNPKRAAGVLKHKVKALSHHGCPYTGSRAFRSEAWRGPIRSWSSCASPGHSVEEIALTPTRTGTPPVYVQIRCDRDCSARTDRILRSLWVVTV